VRGALGYTLGRFLLFVLTALLLWSGAGALGYRFNGLPLLLASLLLSSVASLFLLSRQRERFAASLAAKREAKAQQVAERQARLGNDGARP
jgi:hypothetical protein